MQIDFLPLPLPGQAAERRPWRGLERTLLLTGLALALAAWILALRLAPIGPEPDAAELLDPAAAPAALAGAGDDGDAGAWLGFDWNGVLGALEKGKPDSAEVLALDLRGGGGAALKLVLRADSAETALAGSRQLSQQPALAGLRLTQLEPEAASSVGGDDANPPAAWRMTLEGPLRAPAPPRREAP